MKSHAMLSDELERLRHDVRPYEKDGGHLSDTAAQVMGRKLSLLAKLARNLEQEVGIYRLIEAGRVSAVTLEQAATHAAGDLVLSGDGNVMRPDFSKSGKTP